MRFVRGDVRDPKSTTVIRSGATERFSVKVQKIYFREIFGFIRFSAFATVSANTGRSDGASGSWQLPCKWPSVTGRDPRAACTPIDTLERTALKSTGRK